MTMAGGRRRRLHPLFGRETSPVAIDADRQTLYRERQIHDAASEDKQSDAHTHHRPPPHSPSAHAMDA